jgi:hypothetical protein
MDNAVTSCKLEQNEFKLLLKALTFLALACTDIEIRENLIHSRTDDKVVTYVIELPFQEKLSLTLMNIAQVVKILKTFEEQSVTIYEDEIYYTFHFEDKSVIRFRKPSVIANPYNKEKVDNILKNITLESFPVSVNLLNKIRATAFKFGCNIEARLSESKFLIRSLDNNIDVEIPVDVSQLSDSNKVNFFIHLHALPNVTFVEKAFLHVGLFTLETSSTPNVFYKIETLIKLSDHIIPFSALGVSSIIQDV